MSRERPILFSSAMVRAILDGTKTQTRRAMRIDNHPAVHDWVIDSEGRAAARALNEQVMRQYITTFPHGRVLCPYGAVGDRLWVRETWAECNYFGKVGAANGCLGAPMHRASWPYSTDDRHDAGMIQAAGIRWRPSIHMPRVVSRITLEVTGVRVERLQDISEADAYDEGTLEWADEQDPRHSDDTPAKWPSVKAAYRALWESINGAESWAANPWVWVIEFKRVTA